MFMPPDSVSISEDILKRGMLPWLRIVLLELDLM